MRLSFVLEMVEHLSFEVHGKKEGRCGAFNSWVRNEDTILVRMNSEARAEEEVCTVASICE